MTAASTTTEDQQQHESAQHQPTDNKDLATPVATIVISGAGIVGLTLALALHNHVGVKAEIYERASDFHTDIGAGMGMYPNGLRAIRDISPDLLDKIRKEGYPFLYRRVERHDGSQVVVADEAVLHEGDDDLESIGIRRWRLQKVLYDAVSEAGIPIFFGKKTTNVATRDTDGLVEISFEDGTSRVAEILFGADGSRSKIRDVLAGDEVGLQYTGVTCLMGMADCPRSDRGHCAPSSTTSKCHANFFPTGEDEQCFQFHFPVAREDADSDNWGTLSEEVGKEECRKLAVKLAAEGWHDKYLEPLHAVTRAVRIGFCLLRPKLEHWVYGPQKRIVLVGDAAHPPVPYTGQGAQMGLEDAATISALLENLCVDPDTGKFSTSNFARAMEVYEKLRIPRTLEVQKHACALGEWQQRRAECERFDRMHSQIVQRQVFFHETLPHVLPGARYDYKQGMKVALEQH